MKKFQTVLVLSLLTICFVFMGCGGDKTKLGEVTGKVTKGGKTVTSGSITFTPQGTEGQPGAKSVGAIKDGTFELMYVDGRKGAAIGTHTYTVEGIRTDSNGGSASGNLDENPPALVSPSAGASMPSAKNTKTLEVKKGKNHFDIEL